MIKNPGDITRPTNSGYSPQENPKNPQLIIIPSRKCNMKCSYCPVDNNETVIDATVAEQAIEEFINQGGRVIRITGGEPFMLWHLTKRLLDKIGAIKKNDITTEICTNGTLLDDKKLEALNKESIVLVVSIDGGIDTYKKNRLFKKKEKSFYPDIFSKVDKIIQLPNYFITQTISPKRSARAFEDMLHLWMLGIRHYNFLPVYYRQWDKEKIVQLKQNLFLMAKFLTPFLKQKMVKIRNIEKEGIIALFKGAICLDTDANFYFSNSILIKKVASRKKTLFLGKTLKEALNAINSSDFTSKLKLTIKNSFNKKELKSTKTVDSALSKFVNYLIDGKDKNKTKISKRPERLELHLSYQCTNSCIFCSEMLRMKRFQKRNVTAAEAWGAVVRHAENGGTHINFTGGEPTLHPFFLPLLEGAKNIGMKVYIGTNGAMLHKRDFAIKTLPHIDELSLSLHGSNETIHEMSTRCRGSFNNIIQTAKNAKEINPSCLLMGNMVVTRINFEDINSTIQLYASIGVKQLLISFPSPEGRALINYKKIVVPFKNWEKKIDDIIKEADKSQIQIRFFGFPACILGKWKIKSNDLYFDPRITVERAKARGGKTAMSGVITTTPRRGRSKIAECRKCMMNKLCGGIFTEYIKAFGTSEFKAII